MLNIGLRNRKLCICLMNMSPVTLTATSGRYELPFLPRRRAPTCALMIEREGDCEEEEELARFWGTGEGWESDSEDESTGGFSLFFFLNFLI